MHSALLPIVVVAIAAAAVAYRRHTRRRWASHKVSGGRKALVLNLFDR